jgi:hypothetical protein
MQSREYLISFSLFAPYYLVAVAFQNTFYLEMYQNNIFFIFKKLFLKSGHQNDLKHQKNINLK